MGKVQTLPEGVVNRIAAGEVVERPASIVKELLENALDAQAQTIKVAVRKGGVELIQVDDDGIGMDADDAVRCFTRHATSKISTLADLDDLTTLGFRGEALPSIASVSRMHLVTRGQTTKAATRVRLDGGEISCVEACGAPGGTSIQVSDLFYNTPARLKFLKHPTTEASHVTQCFTGLALLAQRVHMSLHLNERLHTQVPAGTLAERVEAIFGAGLRQELLPLEEKSDGLQVHGLIAKATFHRATRRQQFLFVNGRVVQSRPVSHALYEAYRTLLPRDRHPVSFLFIALPGDDIDVNVHPAKLEVRFRQEARLYDYLRRLFRQRLQESLSTPVSQGADNGLPRIPPPDSDARSRVPMMWQASAVDQAAGDEPVETVDPSLPISGSSAADSGQELRLYAGYPEANRVILEGTPVGQLHDTYILLQYPGGMMFVDQHAAHERVVYERLRAQLSNGPVESQRLLFPATLDLGAADSRWVESRLPQLESLGFSLEHFGGSAFRLLGVPAVLASRDYSSAVMDILEIMRSPEAEDVFEEGLPRLFHRLLTVTACHAAIRAHHRLLPDEMSGLMRDLAASSMPFTCPHGRPVLLHVGLPEIEKKFLRC
ncbi:MAG: DNA mismatch repair endonuclease MutL [Candidatus Tectomicrobia bacterium]|nr:DNA mismatch repair endonuclease MutL [Candidatus Tectomicrobia bacterium]